MYDDESRNAVMMLNRATRGFEDKPAMYEEMYKELRDWVDGSLDMYKGELHSVLYPHLVHCFLEMVGRRPQKIDRARSVRAKWPDTLTVAAQILPWSQRGLRMKAELRPISFAA